MRSSIFWDITLCNLLKVNQCSSAMTADFQWTTWHYILEDRTLQLHYVLDGHHASTTFTFDFSAVCLVKEEAGCLTKTQHIFHHLHSLQ
jgi:hypothetical protein